MREFEGKKVLVTGGSGGIGSAIAARLARGGALVAIGGRNSERLNQVCESIRRSGGQAVLAQGDIGSDEGAKEVVAKAVDGLSGLDSVVNNAGIDTKRLCDIAEWSAESFDAIMSVNSRSSFLITKYSIPHLLEAGGGTFLHISSVCARTVWPGNFAYAMSKAALNMLSNHIAVEYGSRGIASNTLMPGYIPTPLNGGSSGEGEAESSLLERHPIGRYGLAEEIAEAAAFLCFNSPRFLTGANIEIDGGYSCV